MSSNLSMVLPYLYFSCFHFISTSTSSTSSPTTASTLLHSSISNITSSSTILMTLVKLYGAITVQALVDVTKTLTSSKKNPRRSSESTLPQASSTCIRVSISNRAGVWVVGRAVPSLSSTSIISSSSSTDYMVAILSSCPTINDALSWADQLFDEVQK